MEKDDDRIAAVKSNDVEGLARLSDATEWYKCIEPDNGDTLLHVAVTYRRKEVFDYLLANVDVPVDCKNNHGRTALDVCFYSWVGRKCSADHFAYELIKKGASLDCVDLRYGDTLLHLAIRRKYVKVSKLLMRMGCDLDALNARGLTPFRECLRYLVSKDPDDEPSLEVLSALLYHGADPGPAAWWSPYNIFEEAINVCHSRENHHLLKLLFDSFVDDHTPIHFEVILELADRRSALFRDVVERAKNVILRGKALYETILYLFTIDADYLDLLIKKCPDVIREAFACVRGVTIYSSIFMSKFIENANMLLESDLRDDTIDFLHRFGSYIIDRAPFEKDESLVLSFACFLLSYGLQLKEQHLIKFYEAYGYGELFKILLHMDIKTECFKRVRRPPFVLLLYDVNWDLRQILQKSKRYRRRDVEQLIYYFSDSRLRTLCGGSERAEIVAAIENQPDVPLLSELARNVFREHLVNTFNVTKAYQFYTLVNGLPISPAHKKIITLETKLY